MKRSTANGRNSVARFPHALNRCIDNCTSAEDFMPQLHPRERFGGIGLGMTSTGFWRFGRGGNSILINLMLMDFLNPPLLSFSPLESLPTCARNNLHAGDFKVLVRLDICKL